MVSPKSKMSISSVCGATASEKVNKNIMYAPLNNKDKKMTGIKTTNAEYWKGIHGIINMADNKVTTMVFARLYNKFCRLQRNIDDTTSRPGGEKAWLRHLRSKIRSVVNLTNSLNFYARAEVCYPVKFMANLNVHDALALDAAYMLHAKLNVHLAALEAAFIELSWMVDDTCNILMEFVNDHYHGKSVTA